MKGVFILEDGPQIKEQGELLRRLMEFNRTQVLSLGETPTSVDLLQLIQNRRKINVASVIQKVVLPIKIKMLPAHRTNALVSYRQQRSLLLNCLKLLNAKSSSNDLSIVPAIHFLLRNLDKHKTNLSLKIDELDLSQYFSRLTLRRAIS